MVVYGEFAGPKVQKGDACCMIAKPHFFVFAIYLQRSNKYVTFPALITKMLEYVISNNTGNLLRVIPLHREAAVELDLRDTDDAAQANEAAVAKLNALILEMETCDPYIKAEFGIEGPAEGLVFMPITDDAELVETLMFKAKTPHHSEKLGKNWEPDAPIVQVVGQVAASMFAKTYVTPARCEKMLQQLRATGAEVGKYDFVNAVEADVRKETTGEEQPEWNEQLVRRVRNAAAVWWHVNTVEPVQEKPPVPPPRKKKEQLARETNEEVRTLVSDERCARVLGTLGETNEGCLDKFVDAVAKDAEVEYLSPLYSKVVAAAKGWWFCATRPMKTET